MPPSDPHSFSEPTQGTISHIQLHLEPDLASRIVHVQAQYVLGRPVRGSLFLDTRDLDIASIRANGTAVRWSLDREDRLLGQRLHLRDLDRVDRLSIDLRTSPGATALQWLEPNQTAGGRHPFLYSQCQACSARSLFPCQDTPGVRFTYEAELTAPVPLAAVMAAERVGQESLGGHTIHRFRMPQPIPSYLLAFALGDLAFESVGPRTGIYAEPEILQQAAWEFAGNEDRLRAGEALFGPYLWDRYDVLVMPPAFPYGGMENPRLTFLNSVYVQGDRGGTHLIAHELAHAWTGNLVTNATWEDFWLNEGPTTYATGRISEITDGVKNAELLIARWVQSLLREVERLGPDSPETCLRVSLTGKDPNESYTDVAYYKGMLFFRALEQAVGRARFDAFLRDYITTYQFRSISSAEFLAFLEGRLADAARTVDARRWIYEPGLPQGAADVRSSLRDDVLAASKEYKDGRLPSEDRVRGWTPLQETVFLAALLPRVPVSDCAYFEGLFGIRGTRDGLLFSRFCELAVGSGDRDILPAYEAFFASVGRFSFHELVFRALARETWSRPLARPLFERHRQRHHAHTLAAIERILAEAGL
jgi:leukotriene-A4 hydrolase